MLEDSPANTALEAAAVDRKAVPTNVYDTLDYLLGLWAKAEDLQLQKNMTNAVAKASVTFRGVALLTDVPVDQLLGLEARLTKLRVLFVNMPTLDASKVWTYNSQQGVWESAPESTTKTEKIMIPVVLAPATDKHPAQVKESTRDNVVGQFTQVNYSTAVTAVQKADAIVLIDELLVEIKQARMRANETTVVSGAVGGKIKNLLLSSLK
jgi:hypothetical protein